MRNPGTRILFILTVLSALVATGARAGDYDYTTDTTVIVERDWDPPSQKVNVTDAIVPVEYDDTSYWDVGKLNITATNRNSQVITTKSGTLQFLGMALEGTRNSTRAELTITDGTVQVVGASTKIGQYSGITIGADGALQAGTLSLDGDYAAIDNSGTLTASRLIIDGANASVIHNGKGFTITGTTTVEQGSLVLNANATLAGANLNGGSVTIGSGVSVTNSQAISLAGGTLYMGGDSSLSGAVEVRGGTFSVTGKNAKVASLVMAGGITSIGATSSLEATSLTLSGGIINLSGTLTATPAVGSGAPVAFGGIVNMTSGTLDLGSDARFTAGGIVANGDTNFINMNRQTLSVGSNASLDAGDGELRIDGNLHLGAFSVGRNRDDFIYRAGIDADGNVNKVTITGNLSVDQNSKVSISSALLQRLQSDPAESINILEVENTGTIVNPNSFASTVRSTVFRYDIFLDNINGTQGMFIGNFTFIDQDEVLAALYEQWDQRLNNQARTVISGEFANAIIAGTRMYLGDERDTLSPAGLFNAGVLYNLSDPDLSGIGIDALRYYNGSQAANMSEAALSITRHVMASLDDRNAYLRRMQVLIADAMGSDHEQAYGDCILDDGFCPDRSRESVYYPATRIWATALGMRDKRRDDGVVTGFNYHGRGMTVGGDHIFGPFAVGAAFSYVGGDFTDAASLGDSSTLDAYHFNLYGTYSHATGFFLSGTLGYAWTDHRLDDRRFLMSGDVGYGDEELAGSIGNASADYQTGIWTGSLAAGYDFLIGDYLTVSPSLGVAFRSANGDSHSEFFTSENGSANTLELGKVRNTSITMPVKLAVAYDLFGDEKSLMTVTGSLGYAYEFKTRGAKGNLHYAGLENIGNVPIFSSDRGRHAFSVATGLRYMYKNFEFAVDYEYEGRKKFSSHSFSGSVGLTF
ncbi:MAG: autotransporter domain-containing protein [Planctomycetes bacterium]|nr:autotransporter domain-containing protein [Planctomycetota bacterium]